MNNKQNDSGVQNKTLQEHQDSVATERLQKIMAASGVGSRRMCENMIVAGRVELNGKQVTELGTRANPQTDIITVDGIAIRSDSTKIYVMLNKSRGVVSSLRDEQGRADLRQFTSQYEQRLFSVGRLDAETSGLLLLTNDGALAHILAHPRFVVTKTYIAKVRGVVAAKTLAKMRAGIELEDGHIAVDSVRSLHSSQSSHSSLLEISLHSGRNRIVRRLCAAVGHPVIDLVRRQFGPLHLGQLASGSMRELTDAEYGLLIKLTQKAESQNNTFLREE